VNKHQTGDKRRQHPERPSDNKIKL